MVLKNSKKKVFSGFKTNLLLITSIFKDKTRITPSSLISQKFHRYQCDSPNAALQNEIYLKIQFFQNFKIFEN